MHWSCSYMPSCSKYISWLNEVPGYYDYYDEEAAKENDSRERHHLPQFSPYAVVLLKFCRSQEAIGNCNKGKLFVGPNEPTPKFQSNATEPWMIWMAYATNGPSCSCIDLKRASYQRLPRGGATPHCRCKMAVERASRAMGLIVLAWKMWSRYLFLDKETTKRNTNKFSLYVDSRIS